MRCKEDDSILSYLRIDYLLLDNSRNESIGNADTLSSAIDSAASAKCYRKKDLREAIWKQIEPRCQAEKGSIESYRQGYERLFAYCWTHELAKKVYAKRPFCNKIINSEASVIAFTIIFFWLQWYIDSCFEVLECIETYPISMAITICIFALGVAEQERKYYKFPFYAFMIACGLALIYAFDSDMTLDYGIQQEVTIAMVKRTVIMAFSYFLWYPIIYFNEDRRKDIPNPPPSLRRSW